MEINKISVIVPVFNVEKYLHRCIKSIYNQSYSNLEIILINDGSTDNSGKICDELASEDTRIIVIHKENEGSSCARNAGLDIATGTYISFIDSDDYIQLSMYELMLNKMLQYDLEIIEINDQYSISKSEEFFLEDIISCTIRILSNTNFAVWRRLYKKSLIKDMRFIPHIIHQDVFFTMDVLKKVSKYGFLNKSLYHYNTDNESIIRSKYSLEKITIGIRATEYIMNNSVQHPKVRVAIHNYVRAYYTDHYFLLSRNTHIDPNKDFRKKLKKDIKNVTKIKNISLRTFLVLILPYNIMELLSSTYGAIRFK